MIKYGCTYRDMEQIIIQVMNIMKESGMVVRGQDGVECTILMGQYMKGSGIMIVVMVMDY